MFFFIFSKMDYSIKSAKRLKLKISLAKFQITQTKDEESFEKYEFDQKEHKHCVETNIFGKMLLNSLRSNKISLKTLTTTLIYLAICFLYSPEQLNREWCVSKNKNNFAYYALGTCIREGATRTFIIRISRHLFTKEFAITQQQCSIYTIYWKGANKNFCIGVCVCFLWCCCSGVDFHHLSQSSCC